MDNPNITQIPFPGGSDRVPTGALQFQDDWPGLFIRGDEALWLMVQIRYLAERFGHLAERFGQEKVPYDAAVGNTILHLTKLADIIDQDVKVRREK
jgi:hypothetical protein